MVTWFQVGSQKPPTQTSSFWQPSGRSQARCCRTPQVKRGTGSNTPISGSKAQLGSAKLGTHSPSWASQISPSAQSELTVVAQTAALQGPPGTTHWPT